MPAPSTPISVELGGRRVLGPALQLVGLLHVDEQRADHVARGRVHHDLGHVARLDPQPRVDRHQQALVDGRHDGLGRGIVAHGLGVQHGVAGDEHLAAGRAVGVAAGHPEALLVPGLHRLAAGLDVGLGLLDEISGGDDLVHQPALERGVGPDRPALEHHRQGCHGPHQARHALGAAGAGHQADLGLHQAQLDARIVRHHAVVAGEADLQPAAQRQAVDRRHKRLAALLDAAHGEVELHEVVEHGLGALFRRGAGLGGSTRLLLQHRQIGASDERRLGRGHHHALHGRVGDGLRRRPPRTR